jgi:hypothetical protein
LSQDGTLLLYPVACMIASNCSSLPSANLAPRWVTSFTAPTTWPSTHHVFRISDSSSTEMHFQDETFFRNVCVRE